MKGFTLLETIVALAFFLVLASAAATPFLLSRKMAELNAAVEESISLLVLARTRTLSSEEASVYGVHFEEGNATLFKGSVFAEGAADNRRAVFGSSVEVASINLLGGGTDVVFSRLSGETTQSGTVLFRLKANAEKEKILRIERTGVV